MMKIAGLPFVSVLGIVAMLLVLPVAVFLVGQQEGSQNVNSKATGESVSNAPIAAPKGYVIESAYVDADLPDKNLGNSEVLWVDGASKKDSCIKFDLSVLAGRKVAKATLKLYVVLGGASSVVVNEVNDSSAWNSQTLTYNSRPATLGGVGTISGAKTGEWVSVDVTKFVQTHSGKKAAVELETNSPDGLGFSSLSASSNWPELVVE